MGRLYRARCKACGHDQCRTSEPSDTCPSCKASLVDAELLEEVHDPAHNPTTLSSMAWSQLGRAGQAEARRHLARDPRLPEKAAAKKAPEKPA